MTLLKSPFKTRTWKLVVAFSLATLLIAVPLILITLKSAQKTEAVWFDDNYAYRQRIPVTTHAASETNVYVTLTVDTATLTTDKLQADCDDLRFTKLNGQILPYQIVSGCDGASTSIRVGFDTMPIAPFDFYMYYGNPTALIGSVTLTHAACSSTCTAAAFGSEEKATAPTAYWKFDDGTGTNVQDSTPNNIDGTFVSSPTWQTEDQCLSGKCLRFNGSSDNVSFSDTLLPSGNNARTFVFWINSSYTVGYGEYKEFLEYGTTGASNQQIDIGVGYDGNIPQNTVYVSVGSAFPLVTSTPVMDGLWHAIEIVYDGNSNWNFYLDGKFIQTRSQSANTVLDGSGSIGKGHNGYWKGNLDETKIYNYARSATQIQADYNARSNNEGASEVLGSALQNQPPALVNGLIGYWKMDESSWATNCSTSSVIDSSLSGYNGKPCPNASAATVAAGKFGNAGSFDGTNDYVDIGDQSGLFTSGSFSISAWIYMTGGSGSRYIIADYDSIGSQASFALRVNTSGTVDFFWENPVATLPLATSTTTLSTNTWYHVAGTWDGTTRSLYINGKLESTNTTSQTRSDIGGSTAIGRPGSFDGLYFPGKIDETRVYNRALSDADIQTLYNFAPGPVGYWKLDESTGTAASDNSGNGNETTLTNSPTWTQGKFGAGINFAGSNQHLTRADDSDFDFPDDADMSFEAWIKHGAASAQEVILSKYNEAGYKIIMESDGDITCALDYDSTWTPTDSATSTAATYDDNNWHHVACVKNGASSLQLYIDGVLITTDSSITATNTLSNSDPLYIGIDADGTSNDWIGQIDEAKIYSYARSSKQVIEDMNAGHPAPGSPVGSAIIYQKFDEGADNTCSGGTNDVCNSGNAGTTFDGTSTADRTNSGKFSRALDFVSTNGDVVTITNANAIDMDTNLANFTFSTWVYADSDGENDTGQILAKSAAAADETYLRVDTEDGGTGDLDLECNLDRTTDTNVNITDAFKISTWNYVACSWDGTTMSVYVNGLLRGTSASGSGAIDADSHDLLIGGGTSDNFDGKIDEFKVYNSALTAEQVKLDMNRGSTQVLGALSDNSTYQPQAANQEYCVPGDTTSCAAPIGEWRFEEGTGTAAYDTSGNENTGTLTNSPTYTTGKFGKGLNFAGSNAHVTRADDADFDFGTGGSFTLEAWIKHITASASEIILSKYDGAAGEGGYKLLMESDGDITCGIDNNDTSFPSDSVTSTAATYDDNNWHHIACVKNADTSLTLYIDSVSVGTPDTAFTGSTLANSDPLYIGIDADGTSNDWIGNIDHVQIFNYARTAAQIAWDYNKGKPVGWWKMDDCQGTTINDSSGNSLTGALTNATPGTCATSGAWFNGVSGKRNYSLDFDGSDDVVTVTNANAIDFDIGLAVGMTYSAWIYAGSDGENDVGEIIDKGTSTYMRVDSEAGGLDFQADIDLATTDPTVNVADAFEINTWNHVVISYNDDADDDMDVYINGILRSTGNGSGAPATTDTNDLLIGGSSAANFDGQIDDVRVYNYGLTAAQVKTLYNEGAIRFGPSTGAP